MVLEIRKLTNTYTKQNVNNASICIHASKTLETVLYMRLAVTYKLYKIHWETHQFLCINLPLFCINLIGICHPCGQLQLQTSLVTDIAPRLRYTDTLNQTDVCIFQPARITLTGKFSVTCNCLCYTTYKLMKH